MCVFLRWQRGDAEVSRLIDLDEPVPDAQVVDVLLKALLINGSKEVECGMLVDGFPRTLMQVSHPTCMQAAYKGFSHAAEFLAFLCTFKLD